MRAGWFSVASEGSRLVNCEKAAKESSMHGAHVMGDLPGLGMPTIPTLNTGTRIAEDYLSWFCTYGCLFMLVYI